MDVFKDLKILTRFCNVFFLLELCKNTVLLAVARSNRPGTFSKYFILQENIRKRREREIRKLLECWKIHI